MAESPRGDLCVYSVFLSRRRCTEQLHPPALDYPYITSLLPNNTIEVHSLETQAIVQVIGAPHSSNPPSKVPSPVRSATHQRMSSVGSSGSARSRAADIDPARRTNLVTSVGGYLVPSTQKVDKMKRVPVKLLRP